MTSRPDKLVVLKLMETLALFKIVEAKLSAGSSPPPRSVFYWPLKRELLTLQFCGTMILALMCGHIMCDICMCVTILQAQVPRHQKARS